MLTAFSWLLYVFIVGLFAFGVWLCTLEFPGPGLFLGLFVIAVAAELRPRFGRVSRFATEVTAAEAPQLHGLVAQVAAAVGAPVPAVYVEDDEFNASCGAYGLRRRKVLVLGLPLWNALSGQQRVALLGHELGHFVNGDPRRGMIVQPALTTLGRLAALFEHEERIEHPEDNLIGVLVHWAINAVKAVIRGLLLPPRFLLAVLALRDGQRAEYRADRLAAMVAGRAATVELLDMMTVSESALMLLKRDARAGRPVTEWPATISSLLAEVRPNLPARREAELERVSLFASHPPNGLRSQLVAAQANESAAVVLSEATNARIDVELAKQSARSARTMKAL